MVLLYGENIEKIRSIADNGCEIVECTDMEFMKYINKIKANSEFVGRVQKGVDYREIYKFHYNSSHVFIRLYLDDNDGVYYDFLEYQRQDDTYGMSHITWTMCKPKEFCELFFDEHIELEQGYKVTPKEIKKMKAVKFYNKNNEIYWFDKDGYFYQANKWNMPNKRNKDKFAEFGGNKEAVLVKWSCPIPSDCRRTGCTWFKSRSDFLEWWNEEIKKWPVYCAEPQYAIIKVGYTSVSPDNSKVILRLPWYNVDLEIREKCGRSRIIAHNWAKLCHGRWTGGDLLGIENMLDNVVREYIAYIGKSKQKNIKIIMSLE